MPSDSAADACDILLVGGGHAQLAVLRDWIVTGLPCERAILVDPESHARYSGTVPGIISGAHKAQHGLVDLQALCDAAGIERIGQRMIALDPDQRIATLDDGRQVSFTFCSIDTGGVGRAKAVLGQHPRLMDVRPIGEFLDQWRALAERAEAATEPPRIAVIGGGAGGVELACAIRNAAGLQPPPLVALITGKPGVLPEFGTWPRGLVERELEIQGITIIEEDAELRDGDLLIADQAVADVDAIIAAIGSGAPQWPAQAGLARDPEGFVAVDAFQRSTSHPWILASGDVAQRMDMKVPHSGVHAVHTGPVLAANLRALAAGEEPQEIYVPRPASLYLLSTGLGHAVMAYGWLGAQGRWVQRWKDRIDKRWLDQYAIDEEKA